MITAKTCHVHATVCAAGAVEEWTVDDGVFTAVGEMKASSHDVYRNLTPFSLRIGSRVAEQYPGYTRSAHKAAAVEVYGPHAVSIVVAELAERHYAAWIQVDDAWI